jgi:hypothetical protein
LLRRFAPQIDQDIFGDPLSPQAVSENVQSERVDHRGAAVIDRGHRVGLSGADAEK